jgi:hypothetical protein
VAPQAVYPSPLVQLVELMTVSRRAGVSFAVAWAAAVTPGRTVLTTDKAPPSGAIRWPSDRVARLEWVEAITGTREAWRRAYEREEPTACEAAVRALGEALLDGAMPVAA